MRNESSVLTPLTRVRVTTPRPTVRTIHRQRLLQELERTSDQTLTLVVGSPGCGKSLLVSAWAQQAIEDHGERVAWVAAGRDCDDPSVLWNLVVAAWTRSVPAMDRVQVPRIVDDTFVDQVLQHVQATGAPCTLVLEDLHEVQSAESLATLDLLLSLCPTNLHVVMVTRSDPPIALHRLRLQGELTEIRTRELAFTEAEAVAMLSQHGVTLAPADLTDLMAKTEGWAAGIRLAAISLQDRADPAEQSALIRAFAGSQRAIADYLVAEVLDRQPDRLREFLLRTCVVERVDARLANLLAGGDDAAEALHTLERRGAFLTALDDATGWYRYHRLFGEMCRYQLEVRQPALVPVLHARAAAWFADQGEAVEALQHGIRSQDWDLVGRLAVLKAGGRTFGHDGRGVRQALQAIPDGAAPDDPWLATARALGCDDAQEANDLEHRLDAVDRLLADLDDAPPVLTGVRHLLRGVALRAGGRVEDAAEELTRAAADLGRLPLREAPAYAAYLGYSRALLGNCLFWAGDLDGARQELGWASDQAGDEDPVLDDIGLISGGYLALIDALTGEVTSAQRRAAATLELALRTTPGGRPRHAAPGWPGVSTRIALAVAHTDRGEPELADAELAKVALSLTGRPDELLSAVHAWAAVRRHVEEAQTDQAAGDLTRLRTAAASVPQARLVVRLVADAEAELAGALPRDVEHTTTERGRIESWASQALDEESRRRDDAALRSLDQALDLASATGVVRPLVRSADALQPLLHRHRRAVGTHEALVARLLPAPSQPTAGSASADTLTDRELSVLRLLPTMMSNQEIAEELFVSVNTVKAHLKSLYRKLGASSRREAVVLGRGLLAATPSASAVTYPETARQPPAPPAATAPGA